MSTYDLDALWMPFTSNRRFKADPRLLVAAKDMHFTAHDGRKILDGAAGLWCVNAGHARARIVEALRAQAEKLDFAPPFQMGHPLQFELARELRELLPQDLNYTLFTNSGSESVDTALKIALAYHHARGDKDRRVLVGRHRGYHGSNFGGTAVGGIPANRAAFGGLYPLVDHLQHTHHPERNSFSRGQPEWGAELADELETRVIPQHGAAQVAAVIVEPLAGSTGVLVPPLGYLERLRAICDRYGVLLIFDEVITGFGRLGASFACSRLGVVPDIICLAKGLTNGSVPMGAVTVRSAIYRTVIDAAAENAIELYHGYTYSGHPLAAAAALATLALYQEEQLFQRAADLGSYFEDAIHGLREAPYVIDIRNMGMVAAVELEPEPGRPAARGFEVFRRCYEQGILVRATGDTIALSPPLIISKSQIDELVSVLRNVLRQLGAN